MVMEIISCSKYSLYGLKQQLVQISDNGSSVEEKSGSI